MNNVVILDCEASGLHPDSYPIQVGWCELNGEAEDVFYIKPHEDWTYWSYESQGIHNIPRKTLYDVGIDVIEAANRLNEKLKGKVVCTDAPAYDGMWLDTLFETAGVKCEFVVCGIYDVLSFEQQCKLYNVQEYYTHPHDALLDARLIKNLIKRAME